MSMGSNNEWISSLQQQHSTSTKSWNVAVLLSVCLGFLGADRLYLNRTGLGLAKLFTLGGYGVWWIIDVVLLLTGQMKDDMGREIRRN